MSLQITTPGGTAPPSGAGAPFLSRRWRTFAVVLVVMVASTVMVFAGRSSSQAATCDTALTGWASVPGDGVATTTGGGNATPQTITNLSDLKKYAGDSTPRVLKISGTIVTEPDAVDIASNKTVIGADGNAKIQGGINIRAGSSNIIVRNLNIQGAGYGNYNPPDTVAARGANHLWFDHLNLWDAGDGLMDLTQGSDYLTVSWVKFWYTTTSNQHRLVSLIGSGADHDDTDLGKNNATYHHNWFADLTDQRMPRLLFGKGHIYDNYYTNPSNTYAIGVGALGSALIENNYFKDTHNPHQFMYVRPSYIVARGNVYDHTTGSRDTGAGGTGGGVTPFTTPPYRYTADPAADVPSLVSSCAGPRIGSSLPSPPPTTTPPPVGGVCAADYRTVGSWSGGYQGEVTVTAGSKPISGWTVKWNLSSGQAITQLWNGNLSTSGSAVTVKNADYNGALQASASTTFGFTASGTPTSPSLTCAGP
ncbi:cellulose binding domain-containing protein [Streptomyces sp. HPF1205]|uniref:pectate lyase family protein n=1 Tax=Streptomyces sp. HPF1205 TaxID=2873262 RepID=UPI001CEC8E4F|nr:cellulose binding domain-containing protein [Streptomyces sp. HPF1205]